jgi:hypothetical protein
MDTMQRAAMQAASQGMAGFNLDLNAIIGRGFDFGNNFLSAKYAKDAAKFGAGAFTLQQQQPQQQQQQNFVPPPPDPSALATGAITSDGIKFGDTRISWPTIALAAVGVYLVQSPGFSKRR